MSENLLDRAKDALTLAKKAGAADAATSLRRSREVITKWRDGKLENVSDAVSRALSIQLYVDGRYGSMSTSDLRKAALERFVGDAVAMVRALAKDPQRKLPDPSAYADLTRDDLEIFDPKLAELDANARLGRVRALEAGARGGDGSGKIVSVTSSFTDYTGEIARVTSNGFEGSYQHSYVSEECEVSVKDSDGRRPSDWSNASVRRYADLPASGVTGRDATARALARLGAKKVASGTKTVVIEARAMPSLLRLLIAPLSGSNLQQKQSFYDGQVGKRVASPLLGLSDEPLLGRGLGSRPFDSEGMTLKRRALIAAGNLEGYYLDVYYAAKLGLSPTTGGPTNLVVKPGTKSLDALIGDVKDGFLITAFLGGNSNATTGAFSLGFSGFLLEKGEKRQAIAEMNVAGKHLDFWKKLSLVGSDVYPYSTLRSPSLVFQGVSVAGT